MNYFHLTFLVFITTLVIFGSLVLCALLLFVTAIMIVIAFILMYECESKQQPADEDMLNFEFHVVFDDSKECMMYKPHFPHDFTSSFPLGEKWVILLVNAW